MTERLLLLALKSWSTTHCIPREVPTTGFDVWRMFPYRYLSIPSLSWKVMDFCIMLCMLLLSHPVVSNSMDCSTPGLVSFITSQSSPKFRSIKLVMPSNHLILCHPLSSCPQPFPASWSFTMSQLFASGGQSIGASVLPMNTQDWSPLGWTGWISLQSKGLSRVFSNTTVQKHQFFSTQLSL